MSTDPNFKSWFESTVFADDSKEESINMDTGDSGGTHPLHNSWAFVVDGAYYGVGSSAVITNPFGVIPIFNCLAFTPLSFGAMEQTSNIIGTYAVENISATSGPRIAFIRNKLTGFTDANNEAGSSSTRFAGTARVESTHAAARGFFDVGAIVHKGLRLAMPFYPWAADEALDTGEDAYMTNNYEVWDKLPNECTDSIPDTAGSFIYNLRTDPLVLFRPQPQPGEVDTSGDTAGIDPTERTAQILGYENSDDMMDALGEGEITQEAWQAAQTQAAEEVAAAGYETTGEDPMWDLGRNTGGNPMALLAGIHDSNFDTVQDFHSDIEQRFLAISMQVGTIGADVAKELMEGYRDQLKSWQLACTKFSGFFYMGGRAYAGIGGGMEHPPRLEWGLQGATAGDAPAENGGMPGENKDIFGYRQLSYSREYSTRTGDHYRPRVRSVKGYNIQRNATLQIAKHIAAGGTTSLGGFSMYEGHGDLGTYIGKCPYGSTMLIPNAFIADFDNLWDYLEDTVVPIESAEGLTQSALNTLKTRCGSLGLRTVETEGEDNVTYEEDSFVYGVRNAESFDLFCNMNLWGNYQEDAPDVYIPETYRRSLFPEWSMNGSTVWNSYAGERQAVNGLSYSEAQSRNFEGDDDEVVIVTEEGEYIDRTQAYPPSAREHGAYLASNRRAIRFISVLSLQYEYVDMVLHNAERFIEDPEAYNADAAAFNERREADDAFIENELAAYQALIQPSLDYAEEIREYVATAGLEAYTDAIVECAERQFEEGRYGTIQEALEACHAVWSGVNLEVQDEEQMNRDRLRDQCALMALMDDISNLSHSRDIDIRTNGLTNTVCLENYSTAVNQQNYVVNSLLNNPRFTGFYTLTPAKISALTPYLRFYMVYDRIRSSNDGEETFTDLATPISVEVPFGNSLSKDLSLGGIDQVNDMFKTSHERGYGAGINSFEWKYFGKNEFTADKDITAKLSLHFPSLSEFLKNRNLPVDADLAEAASLDNNFISFRYSDMAAYAGAVAHMSELSYTLKVTVGWVYDTSQATFLREKFGFETWELTAIENCFANLILSKVDHTINIKEDGSVTVNIEYIANAGGILRSAAANVMTDVGMMVFDDAIEAVKEDVRKACEGTDGGGRKMLSDISNASTRVRDRLEVRAHSAMIRRLEGSRGHANNVAWTTGDDLLDQKLTEKVQELLHNTRADVGQLSNTTGMVTREMSGDEWNLEPTVLPERIFLIKLMQNEINWLQNYGPQWKQQMSFVDGARVFRNLGPLQGHRIADAQSGISANPAENTQLGRGFELAEIAVTQRSEAAAASADFFSFSFLQPDPTDSETGESIANPNADLVVTNPSLTLQHSIDDYSENLGRGDISNSAEVGNTPDDIHTQASEMVAESNQIREGAEKFIYYFFYQDLIEVLFSIIKENAAYLDRRDNTDKYSKEVERTKVILGNIEIYVPENTVSRFNGTGRIIDNQQVYVMNLGDMPVSVAYFRQWLIHNVVSRNKKTYYILDFIKDTLRDLVVGPLNDTSCWNRSRGMMEDNGIIQVHGTVANAIGTTNPSTEELVDPLVKLQHDYRTFVESNPASPFSGAGSSDITYRSYSDAFDTAPMQTLIRPSINADFPPLAERPILRTDNSREISNVTESFEFVILYASQMNTNRTGDIRADAADGVYHYSIGNNKGIVKNIKFTKAEAAGVREARLEQVGAMRNSRAQLMDKYDVELETFGTIAVLPGTQIYIDPFGLSPLLGDPSETPERVLRRTQGQSLSSRRAVDLGEASTETFNDASLAGVMGIGGYYIIVEATSFIEAGKYMTKIKAMFDHFGGSAGLTQEVEPSTDTELAHQVDCDASMLNAPVPQVADEEG